MNTCDECKYRARCGWRQAIESNPDTCECRHPEMREEWLRRKENDGRSKPVGNEPVQRRVGGEGTHNAEQKIIRLF